MQNLIFVIGATAAGKTYFINEHYRGKDMDILNVYDYQQKAYDEAGYGEHIPFGASFKCLYKANDDLLKDIIEKLRAGRDVVVEQTLFKMKRRLVYMDEIRKSVDVNISFYVMCPSDTRWQANIKERKLDGKFESYKKELEQIEFPNQAEGIDQIYEVVDGEIKLRMDFPKSNAFLEQARADIKQETERIRDEAERKRKREELIESMNTRPFWHYCEVCGKKEFITAQDAFDSGWDYPPNMGHFGSLGSRTCGSCLMKDTLFWKVQQQALPIVSENTLTPEELITWRRIKAEPESLLAEDYVVDTAMDKR
ncbi:MAG: ATP-binding protein [Clostridium sp.]|nr:ATP-binding protein [Clostridium sp.]